MSRNTFLRFQNRDSCRIRSVIMTILEIIEDITYLVKFNFSIKIWHNLGWFPKFAKYFSGHSLTSANKKINESICILPYFTYRYRQVVITVVSLSVGCDQSCNHQISWHFIILMCCVVRYSTFIIIIVSLAYSRLTLFCGFAVCLVFCRLSFLLATRHMFLLWSIRVNNMQSHWIMMC